MRRCGQYGFDGNFKGYIGLAAAIILLLATAGALNTSGFRSPAVTTALIAVLLSTVLGFGLYTTRRGKFLVWNEILDALYLRDVERILDVGCGRGAVLTMTAERLPSGHIVGIDLWRIADQSGNGIDAAERNLQAEGVAERCELVIGDMRALPFLDVSFEIVVSSIAIYNIPDPAERTRAIDEIARVLLPGGRFQPAISLSFESAAGKPK